MTRRLSLLVTLLVVGLASAIVFTGCPPQGGGGGGTNTGGGGTGGWNPPISLNPDEIMIVLDDSRSPYPVSVITNWGNVPFVVGGFAGLTNADTGEEMFSWGEVVNGGIKQDGTGSHVLTYNDVLQKYAIKIKVPLDDQPSTKEFKFANYLPSEWDSVVADFWNVIGSQLSGMANNQITISNGIIIGVKNPVTGDQTGFTISVNGKIVMVDLWAVGDWSVQVPGNTTDTVNLTIIWHNIPIPRIKTYDSGTWKWYVDQQIVVSGDDATTNTGAVPVITGSQGWMHVDGTSTWNPGQGTPVEIFNVTSSNCDAKVTLTVPAGSPRNAEFKLANKIGWEHGEEGANQFLALPLAGSFTLETTFKQ